MFGKQHLPITHKIYHACEHYLRSRATFLRYGLKKAKVDTEIWVDVSVVGIATLQSLAF